MHPPESESTPVSWRNTCVSWRNTCVAAILATWLGGLVFYALLVIPIGADVLGGHTAFGFITRQVTAALNHAVTGILCVLLLHLLIPQRTRPGRGQRITFVTMAACQIALYALHPWLDALLDPAAEVIRDGDAFYERHRAYLLTTTVQWIAGALHFRGLLR